MPNFAGLYLGVDFIDLVVLGSAKGGLQIVKSVRISLFDEAQPLGEKDRLQALPAAIQRTFDAIKLNVGALNFGLPQDEVMVRNFNMPYVPDAERSSAVRFEAQRYLPFKLDDTISDFYITEESMTSKEMGVLFAAVNKETLNRYTSLLRGKAVRLNILDVASIALLRLLAAAKRLAEDQTQVVVYLEKDIRASVIIARDKNVYLAREAGASASKGALLESVLNNIRLSVDYYKRETKEVAIRELILCGDGELPEFERYLKENIAGISVTIFELKGEVPGLNDVSKKQLIALGLAMAHLEKPRPKINLLDQAAKGASLKKGIEAYKPVIIEGTALFLSLAIIQLLGNMSLGAAGKKIARIKEEKVAAAKGVMLDTSGEELFMMEAKVKMQLDFLENLWGQKRLFLTKKLNRLGATLPSGAWVEAFQFVDEVDREMTLNIKGMIYSDQKDEAAIADKMLSDMRREQDFSGGFEDIRLSSLEKVSAYNKEVLAFMVKCVGKQLKSSGLFAQGARPPQAGAASAQEG